MILRFLDWLVLRATRLSGCAVDLISLPMFQRERQRSRRGAWAKFRAALAHPIAWVVWLSAVGALVALESPIVLAVVALVAFLGAPFPKLKPAAMQLQRDWNAGSLQPLELSNLSGGEVLLGYAEKNFTETLYGTHMIAALISAMLVAAMVVDGELTLIWIFIALMMLVMGAQLLLLAVGSVGEGLLEQVEFVARPAGARLKKGCRHALMAIITVALLPLPGVVLATLIGMGLASLNMSPFAIALVWLAVYIGVEAPLTLYMGRRAWRKYDEQADQAFRSMIERLSEKDSGRNQEKA